MSSGRQTRGRQRIPIRRIANQDDLYATFSKRRLGLYKKASEITTLCGVDIGIIVFSPTDNPFSFFHPSMESVIDRYRNPNQPLNDYARITEAQTRARIEALNVRLDQVMEEKEKLKEHEKYLNECEQNRQKGWWEETPIESLNKEQVREWTAWFQAFKDQVDSRIEELKNGGAGGLCAGAGPSYAPQMGTGPNYGVSSESPNLTFNGESEQFPEGFYSSMMSESPFGGGSGLIPGQFYNPPALQETSSNLVPGQFYLPQRPLNPFVGGGQYGYIPPGAQDPSIAGGTGEDGPSERMVLRVKEMEEIN